MFRTKACHTLMPPRQRPAQSGDYSGRRAHTPVSTRSDPFRCSISGSFAFIF